MPKHEDHELTGTKRYYHLLPGTYSEYYQVLPGTTTYQNETTGEYQIIFEDPTDASQLA